MKNLKIGVIVLEGLGAFLGLGLTVYQIIKVVKEDLAEKKAKELETNPDIKLSEAK